MSTLQETVYRNDSVFNLNINYDLKVCFITNFSLTKSKSRNLSLLWNKDTFVKPVLFCQPRVEVTSCFVYKVMGLTFHERINTQLIYKIEIAQVVAKRITKPQRTFLSSNLTCCSFFFCSFFLLFFLEGGGG